MPAYVAARGLKEAAIVELETVSQDGIERIVGGFMVVVYDIPRGTIGAYFPEANLLVPLDNYIYRRIRRPTRPCRFGSGAHGARVQIQPVWSENGGTRKLLRWGFPPFSLKQALLPPASPHP
jgi:hypothetical protein